MSSLINAAYQVAKLRRDLTRRGDVIVDLQAQIAALAPEPAITWSAIDLVDALQGTRLPSAPPCRRCAYFTPAVAATEANSAIRFCHHPVAMQRDFSCYTRPTDASE